MEYKISAMKSGHAISHWRQSWSTEYTITLITLEGVSFSIVHLYSQYQETTSKKRFSRRDLQMAEIYKWLIASNHRSKYWTFHKGVSNSPLFIHCCRNTFGTE